MRELKRRREKLGPEPAANRKNFVEWNLNAELYAFGQRLGERFDAAQLQQAFTHRSYIVQEELRQQQHDIDQPETNLRDNGPLIERGRALLAQHTDLFVRAHYPRLPEAGVQAVTAFLCSEEVLANVAKHLGTADLILSAEFPVESATLAATLCAVVGALDNSDAGRTFVFVRDFVCTQLNQKDVNALWTIERPVEVLQSVCAAQKLGEPEPRLIGDAATNTLLACYQVGIYSERRLLASGFGENVDVAIEVAARNALDKLFGTTLGEVKPLNYRIAETECQQLAQANANRRHELKA